MIISDCDKVTELNTSLDKSSVVVDTQESTPKSRKSIALHTSIVSPKKRFTPEDKSITSERKSILKNRSSLAHEPKVDTNEMEPEEPGTSDGPGGGGENAGNSNEVCHTLEEFVAQERLIINRGEPSFCLRDIDEDDELFLIDIPKHLNPHDLLGVTLNADSKKKKLKISNEKYAWVVDEQEENFTCVMPTSKDKSSFRAVNVKASGKIVLSRHKTKDKVENFDEVDDESEMRVRFPDNLKIRNPLFGDTVKKIKKVKKTKVKEEVEDED